MTRIVTWGMLSALALSGCKKTLEKALDALDGGPQESYCEALCDWGTTCHEADRDLDSDAVYAACVAATEALDADCAQAGTEEGLDPTASATVAECTEAIQAKTTAGECKAFTGNEIEQRAGLPPAACVTLGLDAQETFDAARDATQEGGAEMCDRFSETWCSQMSECLLGDFDLPQEAIDLIGEPQQICEDQLAGIFTNDCVANGLYDPPVGFTDFNPTRMAAAECIDGLADQSCDLLFSGEIPPICAGSFASADDAAGFATGLLGAVCEFGDFIPPELCGG